jgi:hypothetical protein
MSLRKALDIRLCNYLFEQRYAAFRRGTRLTPAQILAQRFSPQLKPAKVKLFQEIMFNQEAAIAFNFSKSRQFTRDVCPPYKIQIVPHKAWQVKHFSVAPAVEEECVAIINN